MQNDISHHYDHSGFYNESLPSWFEYFVGASKVAALTLVNPFIKSKWELRQKRDKNGEPRETRTPTLSLWRRTRCQLRHRPEVKGMCYLTAFHTRTLQLRNHEKVRSTRQL